MSGNIAKPKFRPFQGVFSRFTRIYGFVGVNLQHKIK